MTSTAGLVSSTLEDYLLAGASTQRTRLGAAVADTSTTTITLEDITHVSTGTRLSIGYEDFHVWDTTATVAPAGTATVQRGDYGSSASTHADNAIVTISPEYSEAKVFRACAATVEQLRQEPGLYRVGHTDFAPPHTDQFLLGAVADGATETGVIGVLGVLIGVDDLTEPWAVSRQWHELQRSDTDGSDLTVVVQGAPYTNETIRVVTKSTLGSLPSGSVDVEGDVGVQNTDLIAVGAALRLGAGRAMRRTSLHAQGDTRRANEVAAFSTGNATRDLERRYKSLLQAELVRLRKQFPAYVRKL